MLKSYFFFFCLESINLAWTLELPGLSSWPIKKKKNCPFISKTRTGIFIRNREKNWDHAAEGECSSGIWNEVLALSLGLQIILGKLALGNLNVLSLFLNQPKPKKIPQDLSSSFTWVVGLGRERVHLGKVEIFNMDLQFSSFQHEDWSIPRGIEVRIPFGDTQGEPGQARYLGREWEVFILTLLFFGNV